MAKECRPLLRGTYGEAYGLIRENKTILLEQPPSPLTPTDGKIYGLWVFSLLWALFICLGLALQEVWGRNCITYIIVLIYIPCFYWVKKEHYMVNLGIQFCLCIITSQLLFWWTSMPKRWHGFYIMWCLWLACPADSLSDAMTSYGYKLQPSLSGHVRLFQYFIKLYILSWLCCPESQGQRFNKSAELRWLRSRTLWSSVHCYQLLNLQYAPFGVILFQCL